MLQRLDDWRAQCSADQLAEFDHQLQVHCTTLLNPANLKKRYHNSYHRALVNSKVVQISIRTRDYIKGSFLLNSDVDAGHELAFLIAEHDGSLPTKKCTSKYQKSIAMLLQRGVLFEQDGYYHLPAEIVSELRSNEKDRSWITLVAQTPLSMLYQLVPKNIQETMLKPKATRNELGAWLMVQGKQACSTNMIDQLDDSDWEILLSLEQRNIDSFETLQQCYPEMPAMKANQNYYNHKPKFALRKSLEQCIPEQLRKLCRLGLIGIITQHGDNNSAAISLSIEAQAILKPHWQKRRQSIANTLQEHWLAEPSEPEHFAIWSTDQQIWRLWTITHFLPVTITQQGKVRKNDLKKIAALLKEEDLDQVERLILCILKDELLKQHGNVLLPLPINWTKWHKQSRTSIVNILRGWETWDKEDEKQALTLLTQLPVSCWLKLDEVVEWLQTTSNNKLIEANWFALFTSYQHILFHHINASQRTIYLLPEFKSVVKQQVFSFPAPGWHGANKAAPIHGFISASGEIQLPPDCNHKVFSQLAKFCSMRSIEQMITLQIDEKDIQRIGTNKAALKKIRILLESLQSPLPQAIAYILDKQQSQTAIAQTAATSMLIVLNDISAMHKLHQTGFEFSQPFKDKPELILLDASADAHAFIACCNSTGILLDNVIKPRQWISGAVSIAAWMDINEDREDQWLEISYQKTRSSQQKQLIARIDADYYGSIRIQPTRKTKQCYSMLKSTVQLQAKHVLRLRQLGSDEVNELGLDKL